MRIVIERAAGYVEENEVRSSVVRVAGGRSRASRLDYAASKGWLSMSSFTCVSRCGSHSKQVIDLSNRQCLMSVSHY